MKFSSFVFGFLAGGVTAAVATLLTTPASGKDTINNLKNNKKYWENHLKKLKEDFIELKASIQTLNQQGKENLGSFIQEVKIVVNDWKREMEPHQKNLQDELQSLQTLIEEMEKNLILAKNK